MAAHVMMARGVEKSEDPDAQATLTDYLDYTEYLPSDLNRALTLIGKLDEAYIERANNVHELSQQYATLSASSPARQVDCQALRGNISYNLNNAIKARESAYGEAERLTEMVNRHYNRLAGIKRKLLALPKPPSRDPTPVARSPQAVRKDPPPRITLRLDSARLAASAGRTLDKEKKKVPRSRRITVPGEVLPPPNPDSPQTYSDSDWESIPPSPLPMPTSRVGGSRSRSHKPPRLKPPKVPKALKERAPRPPRIPGMGTNVHSSVAGISTSNALSMLPKPPPDARKGSEHAPWMRLTEYEMALLRKRMKKNAIWTPSETMIRRELAQAGRGPDNYRKQKAECEEAGEEFIDIDNIATSTPGKPLAPGEISADALATGSSNLQNRGMKLNEAKKQKREAMIKASREEAQQATKRLESLGSTFKELFKKPLSLTIESPTIPNGVPTNINVQKGKPSTKKKKKPIEEGKSVEASASKKRKQPDTPINDVPTVPAFAKSPPVEDKVVSPEKPASKKRKVQPSPSTTVETTTTAIPLASPAPAAPDPVRQKTSSPVPKTPSMPAPEKPVPSTAPPKAITTATATSSRPRRVSLTLRGPASPSSKEKSCDIQLRAASTRGSTAPSSATLPRERPRRASATPATPATPTTPAPVFTAASTRSKRPAPGAIMQDQEGGAAVTIGRRTRPPRKDKTAVGAGSPNTTGKKSDAREKENELQQEEQAAGEIIDPSEPRYCLCGDVSWGEMIGCDNDDCEREWFHFDCVGLTSHPGRRTKWYCPECKVKLKK